MNKFDANDVAQNKVMGILAYLEILCLVPIFAAKNSPYARFHANQGLVLLLAEVIYGVIYTVITLAVGWIPVVGWIVVAVLGLASLVFIVLIVLGIMNACSGEVKKLPVIGNITLLK